MVVISIDKDKRLNIDLEAELEKYTFNRATWGYDKLIACSPFRDDNSPSFFMRLEESDGYEAGIWGDSGATGDLRSGNFVKFLSIMREESYEQSKQYLINKYDISYNGEVQLLPPKLKVPKSQNISKPLRHYYQPCTSMYLTNRGISETVQIQANTAEYNSKVNLVWHKLDGTVGAIKYRSTTEKKFTYEEDLTLISNLVYGAELYTRSDKLLIICEGEIDALSWRTAGYNAVALGHGNITEAQINIIKNLPAKHLVYACDNDEVGRALNYKMRTAFIRTGKTYSILNYGTLKFKDVNDILTTKGVEFVQKLLRVQKVEARSWRKL